jgi:gamma-glutamylcyclotransferase
MSASTFKVFSYGSNMLTARLRTRCSSAASNGVAELTGYELRWHKQSKDGSGKSDIVVTNNPRQSVFGVLYEIASPEKHDLDEAEGLGRGYAEIDVQVICEGREIAAKAYQATNVNSKLRPYTWYHAFVMAGAREHKLPTDYIGQIEQISCDEDPERERHRTNISLLEGARA